MAPTGLVGGTNHLRLQGSLLTGKGGRRQRSEMGNDTNGTLSMVTSFLPPEPLVPEVVRASAYPFVNVYIPVINDQIRVEFRGLWHLRGCSEARTTSGYRGFLYREKAAIGKDSTWKSTTKSVLNSGVCGTYGAGRRHEPPPATGVSFNGERRPSAKVRNGQRYQRDLIDGHP